MSAVKGGRTQATVGWLGVKRRPRSAQSAMKCTNFTGKAPRLIGSPSMWPSCEKKRKDEERWNGDRKKMFLINSKYKNSFNVR